MPEMKVIQRYAKGKAIRLEMRTYLMESMRILIMTKILLAPIVLRTAKSKFFL